MTQTDSRPDTGAICQDIQALIALDIDGSTDAHDRERILRHLESCRDCRRYRDDLEQIRSVLLQVEELPVPRAFDERLQKALQHEKSAKTRFNPRRVRTFGFAAAVVAIGLFSYGFLTDLLGTGQPDESAILSMKESEPSARIAGSTADDAGPGDEAMPFSIQEENAETVMDADRQTASGSDPYPVLAEKLAGYDYMIVSDLPEKGELVLMILTGPEGDRIDRELVLYYQDGILSSPDNWLGIEFDE